MGGREGRGEDENGDWRRDWKQEQEGRREKERNGRIERTVGEGMESKDFPQS